MNLPAKQDQGQFTNSQNTALHGENLLSDMSSLKKNLYFFVWLKYVFKKDILNKSLCLHYDFYMIFTNIYIYIFIKMLKILSWLYKIYL